MTSKTTDEFASEVRERAVRMASTMSLRRWEQAVSWQCRPQGRQRFGGDDQQPV